LVIDEHGEGLPVTWAISNKEDTNILTEHLSAVKERTEIVTPKFSCQIMMKHFTMLGRMCLVILRKQKESCVYFT